MRSVDKKNMLNLNRTKTPENVQKKLILMKPKIKKVNLTRQLHI